MNVLEVKYSRRYGYTYSRPEAMPFFKPVMLFSNSPIKKIYYAHLYTYYAHKFDVKYY